MNNLIFSSGRGWRNISPALSIDICGKSNVMQILIFIVQTHDNYVLNIYAKKKWSVISKQLERV